MLYLLLTPDELLSRLATLVPPPRTHALRYHGLFAPNAKNRSRVVPAASPAGACKAHPTVEPKEPAASTPSPQPPPPPDGGSFALTSRTRSLKPCGPRPCAAVG